MELKKVDANRKNLLEISGIENVIQECVDYIEGFNKSKLEKDLLVDVKVSLISYRVACLLENKVDDVIENAMSAPVIRISSSILSKIDDSLNNDIYITYTKLRVSEDKEVITYSVV